MRTLVSARALGDRFGLYLAGRKVGDTVDRGAALAWLSARLREDQHELSRLSDLTGADVAAHRADRAFAVTVDGQDWRLA